MSNEEFASLANPSFSFSNWRHSNKDQMVKVYSEMQVDDFLKFLDSMKNNGDPDHCTPDIWGLEVIRELIEARSRNQITELRFGVWSDLVSGIILEYINKRAESSARQGAKNNG